LVIGGGHLEVRLELGVEVGAIVAIVAIGFFEGIHWLAP
jgi:hypothetical protein